jgi:hypothetical protein
MPGAQQAAGAGWTPGVCAQSFSVCMKSRGRLAWCTAC